MSRQAAGRAELLQHRALLLPFRHAHTQEQTFSPCLACAAAARLGAGPLVKDTEQQQEGAQGHAGDDGPCQGHSGPRLERACVAKVQRQAGSVGG